MRGISLTAFLLLSALFGPGMALAQRVKSKTKVLSCEDVCAGLAAAIRQNPDKLVTRLEDALVIQESCTAQIVATAIDAVNADPQMVRQIVETAINVVPHRAREVHLAVTNFSVPAAVVSREAEVEIRRAELPDGQAQPVFEVRRAESATTTAHVPIQEVRRAQIPSGLDRMEEVRRVDLAATLKEVPKAKPVRKKRR